MADEYDQSDQNEDPNNFHGLSDPLMSDPLLSQDPPQAQVKNHFFDPRKKISNDIFIS